MKQKLVANTLRRIRHSPLRWPLESNYTHIRAHTSDPVQKNIYRQCTRGYIHIYIFHLDHLQERKRQPFLRKYKDSNFSLFCEALILMQNSCVAEPEHQFRTQTRNKTILSDMHVPLEHTHMDIHTTWPTTTYSYKYTSKLRCSTKFRTHGFRLQQGNKKKI